MEITERKFEITLKELLKKLKKLTYISASDRHLESKVGFEVHLDINKNIGVNKDKDQLLINVNYKNVSVYVASTLDKVAQENILDWFYSVSEKIFKDIDFENEKIESEGINLFKKL